MNNQENKKRIEWWPIAIIAAFVLFGGSVIAAVVKSFGEDVSLVSKDYYAKEIAYQDQINTEILTKQLQKEVKSEIDPSGEKMVFYFPLDTVNPKPIKGEILFFRPSSAGEDWSIPVDLDGKGMQEVSLAGKMKGMWRVQTRWSEGSLEFYTERQIMR